MDTATTYRILEVQEKIREDAAYRQLLAEHDALNARFLETVETLSQGQQDAVFDYIGLLNEIHLRTLVFAVSLVRDKKV